MKTEINIRNGSGWNNYPALRELTAFPTRTRGLLNANGIRTLEVQPYDSERPLGIAARYYDADGELVFTQGFDQNDTANWIRQRVVALLEKGIQKHLNDLAAARAKDAFIQRITAWRRNFDPKPANSRSQDKLRAKFGALRAANHNSVSRKYCWELTRAVCAGSITYRDAVAKITSK